MAWEPKTMADYDRMHNGQKEDYGAYLPSEEEIAEQCKAIRKTWSRDVRRHRTVTENLPATIQQMPGGVRLGRAPMVPEP